MNMDRYRLILGSIILVGLLFLAGAVALGHVEEKTSYGLTGILTILGKLVLDFSEWAFRSARREKEDKDNGSDPPQS